MNWSNKDDGTNANDNLGETMIKGKCGCGAVTYQMTTPPMFVHCCHCNECQRQTGAAYVLNAIIEADRVQLEGPITEHELSTPSGKGQIITRCKNCGVAVFSSYMIRLGKLKYVRVGTLDNPDQCPPDAQIFTNSKQAWVPLSEEIPAFKEFYTFDEVWPQSSLKRLETAFS
ncbi:MULTISPECIES: GFA family protein [unclassified Ruegeria]|uniref:GFA family protein n=1 Tax=unclassified Ruegeria TaxID=2625375 RepID=UPI00148856DA|nr:MULTISPECIES: GFA family protein [unclassified Ruegeria]